MPVPDQTAVALIKGCAWLPDLRRSHHGRPVPLRVLGRPACAISGPRATEFFYGTGNLERRTALPGPVVSALFGKGAVHTLDSDAHRARKSLFTSLLLGDGIEEVAKLAGEAFDTAAGNWPAGGRVVLFDEAARAIARGVTRWSGVPLQDRETDGLAADLVAMVDGFATLGPRHWRALTARRRRERWLASTIDGVRAERAVAPPGSALARVAADPTIGDSRTAAVELLNIIRPATAVAWFVAYSAHAFARWPELADALCAADSATVTSFVHEVRRFYPFAPFLGGRATRDLTFDGEQVAKGTLVLLDVYGQHHDAHLWGDPYEFRPARFDGRDIGEFELIPQGGGNPRTGHRCPGEKVTIAVLGALAQRVARLLAQGAVSLPEQDLGIDLTRIPARVSSGVVLAVA